MVVPAACGVGFAIANGAPIDIGSTMCYRPARRGGLDRRQLFATVEPLDPTDRGRAVAAVALSALRDGFAAAHGQPIAAALGRAFADANAAVREENRLRPSDGPDRRVYVGATAVVLDDRELIVAQVPPSQVAIVQEGQVYAFPELESWSPRYFPQVERYGPDPDPLGRAEQATVDVFRSIAAPGDLIVLCASSIPIAAAHAGPEGQSLSPSATTRLVNALRTGDPDHVVDHFDGVISAHGLDDAHAACFTVGRLHVLNARVAREYAARLGLVAGLARPVANSSTSARARAHRARRTPRRTALRSAVQRDQPDPRRLLAVNSGRSTPQWLRAARRERPTPRAPLLSRYRDDSIAPPAPWHIVVPSDGGAVWLPVSRSSESVHLSRTSGGSSIPEALPFPSMSPPMPPVPIAEIDDHIDAATRRTAAASPGRDTVEPSPRWWEQAHLAAMSVAERLAPPRPERGALRIRRSIPGTLSMERHRPGFDLGLKSEWRCRLPRASFGPLARPVLVGILAVLAVFTTYSYVDTRLLPDREADAIDRSLDDATAHIAAAETAAERTIVFRELAQAAISLDRAAAQGADPADVSTVQQRLDSAKDRARGIIRLGGGERLGGLPAGGAGSHALVLMGEHLYVVSDAIYRFDPGGRLVRTLAPGDHVEQSIVGEIHRAAQDDGHVLATDGVAAFAMDGAGSWTVRPLATADVASRAWATAPIAGYGGNLYMLDRDAGRILRFSAEDSTLDPHEWTGPEPLDDIRTARDLVVDGEIHVLGQDGRVLTFYQGVLDRINGPPPGPELIDPIALSSSSDGQALFLVDAGDEGTPGRVFRLDLASGAFREFIADPIDGALPFLGLQDAVIDESTNTMIIVANDALWRLTIAD